MVGNLAASNQSAPFSSSSKVVLVVEIEAIGTLTSTLLAAGWAGSIFAAPPAWLKSPYQVEKPRWERLNRIRVWVGSTA